jgi:hypothetical protein
VDLGLVLKVIHALLGALFMAGLIGRWVALAAAERSEVLPDTRAMLRVSARFERIVIVSSTLVLLLGVATAIAQGRPFLGPFQGAGLDWLFVSLVLYLSALPLVPLVFLPRGRVFDAALEAAGTDGTVTPAVRAAFADPLVRAAHAYELGMTLVVFVLMVAKPF